MRFLKLYQKVTSWKPRAGNTHWHYLQMQKWSTVSLNVPRCTGRHTEIWCSFDVECCLATKQLFEVYYRIECSLHTNHNKRMTKEVTLPNDHWSAFCRLRSKHCTYASQSQLVQSKYQCKNTFHKLYFTSQYVHSKYQCKNTFAKLYCTSHVMHQKFPLVTIFECNANGSYIKDKKFDTCCFCSKQ